MLQVWHILLEILPVLADPVLMHVVLLGLRQKLQMIRFFLTINACNSS